MVIVFESQFLGGNRWKTLQMPSRSLRKGEGKGEGRCQLKTSKCQRHSTLCCKKCHKLDKNGKLKEVVKYKPNTETQCEWTGLITSMGNHCLKYHGFREGAREYWKEIHKDKAINPFTRARKSQNQENPILQNQNISTADLDINESDDADRVHVPDSAVSDQVIEILSQNSNSSQSAIINAMQNVVLESDMIPDLESGDKRDTVPVIDIEIDSESGSNHNESM